MNKGKTTCSVCHEKGHTYNYCSRRLALSQLHVIPFGGSSDILSNFYPCKIEICDITFPSAEHAYQYTKARMCGYEQLAAQILDAPTAWQAKKLSRHIDITPQWEEEKFTYMGQINRAKCYQVKDYYDVLCHSQDSILVEAVLGDTIWSCGLPKTVAAYFKPEDWPGENRMGQIHMWIRNEIVL